MKDTLKTNKTTFDLTDKNKAILEEIKKKTHVPFGQIINILIQSVCNMPKGLHDTLRQILESEYDFVTKKFEVDKRNGLEFFCDEERQELQTISDLLMLMEKARFITSEDTPKEMKEFFLANGCLTVPADWILVNEEQAQNSRYAAVLEYWGDSKYKIPHFIYLYDEKKGNNDFSEQQKKDFYAKCIEKYPELKTVLEELSVNQPFSNSDRVKKRFGIFCIPDANDCSSDKAPYGAVIVREKK